MPLPITDWPMMSAMVCCSFRFAFDVRAVLGAHDDQLRRDLEVGELGVDAVDGVGDVSVEVPRAVAQLGEHRRGRWSTYKPAY